MLAESPPTKLNVTRRVFPFFFFQGNRIVLPKDDIEMMSSAEYVQGEELEGKTGRKMKMKASVKSPSMEPKYERKRRPESRVVTIGGRRTENGVRWQASRLALLCSMMSDQHCH